MSPGLEYGDGESRLGKLSQPDTCMPTAEWRTVNSQQSSMVDEQCTLQQWQRTSVISWGRRANSGHVDGEDVDGDHGESEWLVTGLVTGDMNEV